MDATVLSQELAYFEEQKAALLNSHPGQYALIKGRQFAGAFSTFEEAYKAGLDQFGHVSFLIKAILEQEPVQQIPALTCGLICAAV